MPKVYMILLKPLQNNIHALVDLSYNHVNLCFRTCYFIFASL